MKFPKQPKKKKRKIQTIKESIKKYYNKYIRLKECYETTGSTSHGVCVTCGKTKEFRQLECGHFIHGAQDPYRFHEDVTHIQCTHCNKFANKSHEYLDYMYNRYGVEHTENLRALRHSDFKYTRQELEDLEVKYKLLCKEWESY